MSFHDTVVDRITGVKSSTCALATQVKKSVLGCSLPGAQCLVLDDSTSCTKASSPHFKMLQVVDNPSLSLLIYSIGLSPSSFRLCALFLTYVCAESSVFFFSLHTTAFLSKDESQRRFCIIQVTSIHGMGLFLGGAFFPSCV